MAKGTCSSNKMCAMTCCPCVLDLKAIKRLADAPRFICKACGRVANSKKNLCEPAKM